MKRDDVAQYVRALMKGQHMEMAIMLREGRFDEVIAGRAVGGMQLLEEPPRLEVQKLATKKEERVEARPSARSVRRRLPRGAAGAVLPQRRAERPASRRSRSSSASRSPKAQKARFRLNVAAQPRPAARRSTSRWATPRSSARDGAIALENEKLLPPARGADPLAEGPDVARTTSRHGNGVFLRIRQPVELEIGDEFIVGDQLLLIERNPEPNDGPGAGPTYFYSSPKWPSSFRVVQIFEGGAKGACVVARGTTMQIGSAIGDFVFTADPLVDDQHCLVEEQAGAILLSDLGSRTGVFVRIKGEQELVAGDEIIVGRTRMALDSARPA